MSRRKLTTEEFVTKARLLHGNKYEYHKTVYTHSHEQLTMTCPKHGDWTDKAYQHVRTNGHRGCPNCDGWLNRGPRNTLGAIKWVEQAKAVHGNAYDYAKSVYEHSLKPITIRCPLHGDWSTTPNNHVHGKSGCPTCAGRVTNLNVFVKRAEAAHGKKYSYDLIASVNNAYTSLPIRCSKHGIFWQAAEAHLRGHGCSKCGNEVAGAKQRGTKRKKMTIPTV